jgi:isoleucyl-tRNA synthetase
LIRYRQSRSERSRETEYLDSARGVSFLPYKRYSIWIMPESKEKSEVAKREEETLEFWRTERIFEKSLQKPSPKGNFTFYEGPPTANGRPGIHHLESRAFKDAVPRYKTMRGYRVARRAGWDTHGLPVELEVEKQLGFVHKKQIEEYGVAAFNAKCRESVLAYIGEWQHFTKRIGYWVDQAQAYFTFNAPYMEAVWSVFAKVAHDGRVYKDYRIVPWCPRDETALSTHELAQGYQDVKDLTVTAKFKLKNPEKIGLTGDVYMLAWTTTPWTLPGNVALAVGPDIIYTKVLLMGHEGWLLLAKDLVGSVTPGSTIDDRTWKGSELVGLEYEPLYPFAEELAPDTEKAKFNMAFKVYAADFVTTETGTGIVHTAVMYGQEDFDLGHKIGLPKVHLVNSEGRFINGTAFLTNKYVVEEETAVEIIKDLAARDLLFAKSRYEHAYPFCWRCKTRLIYYARNSWYIRMHDLRGKLVEENNKVHWVPEHIREGRMGEWLANAKDWAISRERYWGTPLPIWHGADGVEQVVIGSVSELKKRAKRSGNEYFVMRHGEAEQNVGTHKVSSNPDAPDHLTLHGKEQIQKMAQKLAHKKIDRIIASPFIRTRETADLLKKALHLPDDRISFDPRIQEPNLGAYEGKPYEEYEHDFPYTLENFSRAPEGGESFSTLRARVGSFLYDLESKFSGERILIIAHGYPIWLMYAVAQGLTAREALHIQDGHSFTTSEMRGLDFVPLPHNENYELDLHKPYIDEVVVLSDSGKELRRVPEVMDVWFDSGAMPFAQDPKHVVYPADYISEAIDQTRGWFYTLLAIGTLMGRGEAYKNVICLGHLLDANGQKMSKSKGNVVTPSAEIEKWGADTLRYWMYSVNQPGDSKNYDEKTVKEAAKILAWLENSAKFYELFKQDIPRVGNEQVLDRWMKARTAETVRIVTQAMEAYDLYTATREIGNLSEDLSQWYVRRIRERVRDGDAAALETLRTTLETSARLLAPFAPFLAERIFQTVKGINAPESVHLAQWPRARRSWVERAWPSTSASRVATLLIEMELVRSLASQALQLRQQANIKVRQPLAKFSVPGTLSQELATLLAEEINVKKIESGAPDIHLDTMLTPELISEGEKRELDRAFAEARKTLGLSPKDKAHYELASDGAFVVELAHRSKRFNVVRDAA